MKSLLLALSLSAAVGAGSVPCEFNSAGLMKYERQILTATEKFATKNKSEFLRQISLPLFCVLQIQEKAEVYLRVLANSFLKPLMGGGQIRGVPVDKRYEAFSLAMTCITERSLQVPVTIVATTNNAINENFIFPPSGRAATCAIDVPVYNRSQIFKFAMAAHLVDIVKT